METVGGALLAPAFKSLFKQLTSPELLRFARKKHVETELKKWEGMLKGIYGVLEDVEEQQTMTSSVVRMWVSQLSDLAYDVEDILDEFDFEVRRSKMKAERVGRRMFKVRKLVAKMNPKANKSNIEMISKIKAVTARLEEITSQKNQLELREVATGRTGGTSGEERATSCLVNTTEVYGREEDKKAILQLLNYESTSERAHLTVIGIVGMGGVGKTTLAKLIFDEAKKKFDVSAWISVGEDFNVIRLTKCVLRSMDAAFSENDDLNKLQVRLKEKLSSKNFLIVLDDVWNQKYEDWTLFRLPLENGARTSRIILTTRTLAVSQMMDAVESYPLNQLTTDESLCLLALHAFGKPNFHNFEDLEDLGKRIVARCGRLPLAVKAVGGLLKAKPTRSAWENVLKSGIWNEKSHILPSLRLSYHYLAPHLKRCFAYCAIFPKDYEFDHKELVKLWMAEGFLQPSSYFSQNRMQLGYEYFENLLSRSLFQESSTDRSKYVMHDLVIDLSRSVNEEMCLNLDDMSTAPISHVKVRHLAFTAGLVDNYQRFEGLDKLSNLRTFLALYNSHPIGIGIYKYASCDISADKVVHKLVPKWKRLRVLSLVGYKLDELPSSIGVLKHLRDLDLSYAKIIKLPQSLGNLINLETLNLQGCRRLKKLPTGIGNLINLVHLDLESTDSLVELPQSLGNLINLETLNLHACAHLEKLPAGIGNLINLVHLDLEYTFFLEQLPMEIANLKNLQTISKFIVGKANNALGIRDLINFPLLAGKLRIEGLNNIINIRDADVVDLNKFEGVHELALVWSYYLDGSQREEEHEFQVFNSLKPHRNLEKLFVEYYRGKIFPSWIGDPTFANMMDLTLSSCRNITSLPSIGGLPKLKNLCIKGMSKVEELGVEFYGENTSSVELFPSLETLSIENMSSWKQWSHPVDSNGGVARIFPRLHQLTIKHCPELVGTLPTSLSSLEELRIESCQHIILKCLPHLSSLKTLDLDSISELKNLDEVVIESMVGLESLKIRNCNQLISVWQAATNLDNLSSLNRLEIQGCKKLVSVVGGEVLPCSLKTLRIMFCDSLESLPENGMNEMSHLECLDVFYCASIKSITYEGLPLNLRELHISSCEKLQQPVSEWKLNRLTSLTKLCIDGKCESTNIGSFPDKEGLWLPTSLTFLLIKAFENLKLISSGINRLTSLQNLHIWSCAKLEFLPREGLPTTLGSLIIMDCPLLSKRCRKNKGEYWSFIANIPYLYIDEEEEEELSLLNNLSRFIMPCVAKKD